MRRLLILLAILCLPIAAFGAGSWETSIPRHYEDESVKTLTLEWTADAAAATVPNYSFTTIDKAFVSGWNLFMVVTDPGATAPTDNYDITILDQYSVDVAGGELEDRDTTNTEQVVPSIGSAYGGRTIDGGTVTVTVSNNAVNSASGKIILFFGM